ncbi:hypothetical protein [Nostoc sp.]|uniref:hypothetical protein n=1 Tax=Nostoc sp. TaxID=1180 RepID=UPI002FF9973B
MSNVFTTGVVQLDENCCKFIYAQLLPRNTDNISALNQQSYKKQFALARQTV